ncbi:hypothetical protein PICMEDRAFT_16638 [Pichia membranifaciens NRRL Y-2026]|uniref:Uncharacterized protein n=1 Tax=Pichia membranifaciens NRRL Y-2026 TaxID=763406 RepID=A0A1E3NL01_9ASCO|nr:hypothetical protein PICMEDRAFT_16638 [Pichia membranifaciens NRRL Y-2026]ODQ46814.1 hypothetical protein PICMEDRAFT_16638 [Pichia membranifaciens NRRL Y-2026]
MQLPLPVRTFVVSAPSWAAKPKPISMTFLTQRKSRGPVGPVPVSCLIRPGLLNHNRSRSRNRYTFPIG